MAEAAWVIHPEPTAAEIKEEILDALEINPDGRCCTVPFMPRDAVWSQLFRNTEEQQNFLMDCDPAPDLVGFSDSEYVSHTHYNDVLACGPEGRVAVFRFRVWVLMEMQPEGRA
jgi:hypothetical protein